MTGVCCRFDTLPHTTGLEVFFPLPGIDIRGEK